MAWGTGGHGSSPWGGEAAPVVLPAAPGAPAATKLVTEAEPFGVDVDVILDASPDWRLARGRRNLANALARRLTTPRGGLFYDPDYGLDLREYLHAGVTRAELGSLPSEVQLECLKDPRVRACAVAVAYLSSLRRLRITITVTTAVGPFRLVLDVSQLTVALLDED